MSLEERIRNYARDNPGQEETTSLLLDRLSTISREFSGDTRAQLEEAVRETFERHVEIVESEHRALVAAQRLAEKRVDLSDALRKIVLLAAQPPTDTRH